MVGAGWLQSPRRVFALSLCALATVCVMSAANTAMASVVITDFAIYAQRDVKIGVGTIVGLPSQLSLVGAGTMVVGVGDAQLNGTAGIHGNLRAGDDVSLGNSTFVSGTITNPDQFTVGSGVTYGAHIVAMPDLPTLPVATVFSNGLTRSGFKTASVR